MGLARPNRRNSNSTDASELRRGGRGASSHPTGRNGSRKGQIDFVRGVLKVTIPSDYSAGRDVQERIMEEVHSKGYGPDNTFAIRIALEEALVNAIKHGNNLDPNKQVIVEARVNPSRVEITIEDEGRGFQRGDVPDPCAEENLLKCSGRGLLLIESYMDSTWTRGGRRVKMVKKAN